MQAIKIPTALFGMPRKGLVVDLEPLLFHKVLAPLIRRLGVIQSGQWQGFGAGGHCELFSPDTHDHQLAGDLQVAGVRQRLCRRQVPVGPGLEVGGLSSGVVKRGTKALPAVIRGN